MAVKASLIAKSLKKDDIINDLITVFNENKGITGKGVSSYCLKYKMNDDDTLNILASILSDLLYRPATVRNGEYDADELKIGMNDEKEHTKLKKIQEIIAKDHLNDVPDYYSEMKKAEIR